MNKTLNIFAFILSLLVVAAGFMFMIIKSGFLGFLIGLFAILFAYQDFIRAFFPEYTEYPYKD